MERNHTFTMAHLLVESLFNNKCVYLHGELSFFVYSGVIGASLSLARSGIICTMMAALQQLHSYQTQ